MLFMIDDDDSVFLYIYFPGARFYCIGIVMMILCFDSVFLYLYFPRAGFYCIGVVMMILHFIQDCILYFPVVMMMVVMIV